MQGCRNDDLVTTPAKLPGSLRGTVSLAAEDGSMVLNRSGVRVFLEGAQDTSVSDSAGQWRLDNIPAGKYNVVSKFTGFGYTKLLNVEFRAGSELSGVNFSLNQIPSYRIDTIKIHIDADTLRFLVKPSFHSGTRRSLALFFGERRPVADSTHTWLYSATSSFSGIETTYTVAVPRSELLDAGFQETSFVYLAVYAGSNNISGYYIPAERKSVISSGLSATPRRTAFSM